MNPHLNPLYPLNLFYERESIPLPAASQVQAEQLPDPYRALLAGEHDMTPTLERFHNATIELDLLRRHLEGDSYSRIVALKTVGEGSPVEFGAIIMHLEHFPPHARLLVLDGHTPLGTILARDGVEHASCPQGYIRVAADAMIADALHVEAGALLYGRRNILVTKDDRILADIVEILPP